MSPKFLAFCSIILALCIVFCLILYPDKASSGPYLDSAHANTSYGVNRSGLSSFNYSVGNCAHCHEQHASIGGTEPSPNNPVGPSKYELFQALFGSQSGGFCFGCHKDRMAVDCQQISLPFQYNYSRLAGGDTNTCPDDIKEAFQFVNNTTGAPRLNCGSSSGSSHYLDDIQTFLTGKWKFGGPKGDINPCSGCHNPHGAKRDPHTTTGRTSGGNLVISSVSKPSQHNKDNNAWQLWGDENGERMTDYALSAGATYQAPCSYPWSTICTSYEPDGSNVTNGSNLFDSVTFCLDCHSSAITTTGQNHYEASRVEIVNWGSNGNIHGARSSSGVYNYGDKKAPYPADPSPPTPYPNYVLSCLDCHEPHGSPNYCLLRNEVNGTRLSTNIGTDMKAWEFCSACHTNIITTGMHLGLTPTSGCMCHRHGDITPTM